MVIPGAVAHLPNSGGGSMGKACQMGFLLLADANAAKLPPPQAAHVITKTSRERLALALREVGNSIRIARDTRRKQALTNLLEVLLRLQQAANLQRALKWVLRG